MSREKKLDILVDVLGNYYRTGDECLFFCPFCRHHKKKLSINVEKNMYKCWVCDSNGRSIKRMISRYGSYEQRKAWSRLVGVVDLNEFDSLFNERVEKVKQTVSLPKEMETLTGKSRSITAAMARNYLSNRGLSKEDVVRWKIGYCASGEYERRIIVPSFDNDGNANYFVARSYGNSYPKYKNPPVSRNIVFNDLYVDWDDDIIIVEGVFDAIVAGPNAIPILGSKLGQNSTLFQEIVKHQASIYVALDPDAERKAIKLINDLLSYGIEIYKIDIDPYGDVGEMSKEEFRERKNKAKPFDTESCLLYKMVNSI